MPYLYDDDDNVPMNDDGREESRPESQVSYADMRAAEEALPFDDPPENGCWNCLFYDGDRCSIYWNNNEPEYYQPDRDDKKPSDICEDWVHDDGAVWEDYFDGTDS